LPLTESKTVKTVIAILGIAGAIGGAIPVYDRIKHYVKDELDAYVHIKVDAIVKEASKNVNGEFRTAIVDEFNRKGYTVTRDDLARMFAEAYVWTDSLKLFDKVLKPNLIFDNEYKSISLYKRKSDGTFWYYAPDDELYRAYKITNTTDSYHGYYKYIDKHGKEHLIHIDGNL
jgi:hypothetical protein